MLRTEEVDLAEEQEKLRAEMEEIAEEQVKWQHDPERAEALLQEGKRLEQQAAVLGRVADAWEQDSITFKELSEGERKRVEDFVDDHQNVSERAPFVAVATVDAPYLEHDPENITDQDFEETVFTLVSEIPVPFLEWAEQQIADLSGVGDDEGNDYFELVLDKLDESDEMSGEPTAEPSPSPEATTQSESSG